ncbi:MAG: TetR family transcriptional regulator [Frankiales bacterium]|nr:TetR family transcriptional regulator [Frankiales bacterium]
MDAAVAVVEAEGFAALSLRSVARHLGVGPMTLYTYVESSDELAALVVERLVEETVQGVRWPRTWRGVLRTFAKELDGLISGHPAMVEAYGRGLVRSGRAAQVAKDVQERLVADGLSPVRARDAYLGVHALVLGYAVMRGADPNDEKSVLGTPLARVVDELLEGIAG